MALGAVAVRSQTAVPVPTPPSYWPGYGPYGSYNSGMSFAGAISLPYAFNWDALGVSAELGGVWAGRHFFGGEVSYYGGDSRRYDVYNAGSYAGHFYSEQQVTTADFAYRYFAPLAGSGPYPPIAFYVGGSAGIGSVTYSNSGSAFGFHNDNVATFSGDLLAGFQFNPQPGVGLRLGYRYIYINDAWRFNQRVNLGSSAVEASIGFRF